MAQDISDLTSSSVPTRSRPSVGLEIGDAEVPFREALLLWLRWNEAYEHGTAHLYAAGQSAEKIEDFMDSLDQLRREAISLSRQLLD